MRTKKFITGFLLTAALSLLFLGCPPEKEENDDTPTVTSVTVDPPTASVAHGGHQEFTAVVTGQNNPAETVTWSVEGAERAATDITENGDLSVASNETTGNTIIVRATSNADPSKSGTATVTVTAASATVSTVTVRPNPVTIRRGSHQTFTATVAGTNSPAQTVTWTLTGGGAGTNINRTSGQLTVAAAETAATLTVTATSTLDTTKSGNAIVTVSQTAPVTPTDSRILNPATSNTQLTGNSLTVSGANHGGGNKWLIQPQQAPNNSRAYGYETWDEANPNGSFTGTASFTWYGTGQGGGLAFKSSWTNVKDFLARTGFNWNEGKSHSEYGNLYCGFNYKKDPARYNGMFSYIGIYGWSRNPGASVAAERLIEYYIVEDTFGNRYRDPTSFQQNIGPETLDAAEVTPSYTMDGATYKVYKKTRTGPSIAGNTTFTQFFSVRQNPRQNGTISISEHFNEWDKRGMYLGTNMHECKFKVEAGGNETGNPPPGTGTFDASLIQFYRANDDGSIIEITQ